MRTVGQDGEHIALGAQLDIAAGLRDPADDPGAPVRETGTNKKKLILLTIERSSSSNRARISRKFA